MIKHFSALLTAAATISLLTLSGCSSQPQVPDLGSDNGGLHGYWKPWTGGKSSDGQYGDDYWAAASEQEIRTREHAPVPAAPMLQTSPPELFPED